MVRISTVRTLQKNLMSQEASRDRVAA